MDILFSGRAAPGQNVRIPRARAAVSVGTVATRWRGFTHTPAVLHAAAERDSKTHLPSQTIHCGQQTVTAEEDLLLLSFLSGLSKSKLLETNWCVVHDSTVVHRPIE